MAEKRKRRAPLLRFRKGDPAHNLHAAVQHWVRANGGELTVTGGIEIQDWREGPYHFRVAIRCLGRRPIKTEGKK